MLLTNAFDESQAGGRELLSALLRRALHELFGDRLIVHELHKGARHTALTATRALRGELDGLNAHTMERALHTLREQRVTRLLVDGSNFGALVAVARRRFPQLRISTFFHNVEAMFFLGALRQAKSLRAAAVLAANFLAERKAVRYSDQRICMSARDSELLQTLYGRPATHLLPLAVEDRVPAAAGTQVVVPADAGSPDPRRLMPYALFVGGNFYANRDGVRWFVANVAPRIDINTVIVGRGLEALRPELEMADTVVVVGAVDDLAHWYRHAQCVIAPIFGGSGMKTKVAEALMFGKKIAGTAEAFTGYEDVIGRAGWLCATADDFVAAMAAAQRLRATPCDPALRAIYEQRYSFAAARSRIAGILGDSAGN